MSEPVAGISATPYQDNLRYFAVAIEGPGDSPYEKGVFQLELFLPSDYPMAPPKVRFLTKIYHPNADHKGNICLSILKDEWAPTLTTSKVLEVIVMLLKQPNPNDPLFAEAAQLYVENRNEYMKRASEITRKYATHSD